MTYPNPPVAVTRWLMVFCILLLSGAAHAQCAGTDGAVTVCEKDADPANQNFDLSLYIGAHDPGGSWSTNDPANFFALDRDTGIVNLWEVKNSGVHEFTYTNSACGQSAVVTVSLGGYPGKANTDGTADACGDNARVNLHRYIGNETEGKLQDFNGTWTTDTPEAMGFLSGSTFNADGAGIGTYEFTHTVPAVGSCPSREVDLVLEVQRPADSGEPSDLTVCVTDDLSALTNFDLKGLLAGEDDNGTWSESTTKQLSDLTDNIIDVQAIRDTYGYGSHTFIYTVFPGHPVCEKKESAVNIIILPTLRGTMEPVNYCVGPSSYIIDLSDYNDTIISDGKYRLDYTIASASGTTDYQKELTLRNDGTGFFTVNASEIKINEATTLTFRRVRPDVCPDIQVAPITFAVTDPMASVSDTCEGIDVPATLENIFNGSLRMTNGSHDVTYTLTAPSGAVSSFTLTDIAFDSGTADFLLPAVDFNEIGAYAVSFKVASGFDVDCEITDNLTIIASPAEIDLELIVDDFCDASEVQVIIDAPELTSGNYTIEYDVTRQDTGEVVFSNVSTGKGGQTTTSLPEQLLSNLASGNYTVSLRSSQNDTTPCRSRFDFEVAENFAIEGVPALPVAEARQTLCLSAYAPDTPTLADIAVTADGDMMFYATATDMDILPLDTALVDGENYFISNIDLNNNCEGSDRIQVTITLADPQMPTASDTNPVFCDAADPVVANLNASISNGASVVWFETASGGTALENETALIDGKSYYAATDGEARCLSSRRLEIVPTIYALEPASLRFANWALCGLDNPTVADLRDAEGVNPNEVLWYGTAENGTPLPEAFLLTNNTVYFAESYNPDTGCINPEPIAIMVDLTECDPDDYGFFIPDGFSPNGDGRNDTFFVPNIEVIFPDFTLEILNRYGSSLFKGNLDRPAWDGSNRSGTAPNGVYFYIIDYNKEGHEPIQGRLYLNR